MKIERFSRAGPRGRGREWATLRVHPLSWLLSNNRLEGVCGTLTTGTFSSRLLLSNQDKGCTPSVAHSLPLPLGPALLNLWNISSDWISLLRRLLIVDNSNCIKMCTGIKQGRELLQLLTLDLNHIALNCIRTMSIVYLFLFLFLFLFLLFCFVFVFCFCFCFVLFCCWFLFLFCLFVCLFLLRWFERAQQHKVTRDLKGCRQSTPFLPFLVNYRRVASNVNL